MKVNFIGIFFSLRWPNLFITALTLCVAYFFLLIPINVAQGHPLNLEILDFLILTFSCLFIMAGGYIINDLMDVESDFVNKKQGAIAVIPRRIVLLWYGLLSISGLLLGLWLCFRMDLLPLWSIHLVSFILLLLYSTNLKSTPLAGNLVIALLCGIVPLLPLMFDKLSFVFQYQPGFVIINFLSLFAFLITLIREMVKDMEDEFGDRAGNLATFPVIFGMEAARWTTFIFFMMFMILILGILYLVFGIDWLSTVYILATIFAPMVILSYKITKAEKKEDFGNISRMLKFVMLAGLIYALVYYFSYL